MSDTSNQRIAKNTFFLYLRSIFLLVISLYTSRVTLQILGVEDYGIYQLVGGVVAMFNMLSGSLASASQRFITFSLGKDDLAGQKKVFSTCVTLHIVLGIIVVALLEVLGIWFLENKLVIPPERLDIARWVMQFSIATFFFNVISVPFNATIIAHEKMNAFAFISILEGVLKLVCVLFLGLIAADKLLYYALFLFLISVLLRAFYSVYSHRKFEEARGIKLGIEKGIFKEMFAFAGWNMVGEGSMILRNQGIDILLNMFFGVIVNAAKGISNQVQSAVHQFVGNFTTAIRPQLVKSVAQQDYARTHSLIFHGTRLSFFLMMVFSVPLSVCTIDVMELWLVDVPQYAVDMVKVSLLYLQSNTLSRLLINSILAHGNIRNFQITAGVTKLMALPIAYVVLKLGGSPLTGLWVNVALDFVCRGVELYFVNKKLNYNIKKHLLKADLSCWLVFILAYVISIVFYKFVSSHLIVAGAASVLVTSICVWFIGLDKSEKTILLSQFLGFKKLSR